jgi:hypothetical protein
MAILLKGLVAFVIVSSVALYFYLVANEKRNPNESLIGRIFAVFLFIAMIVTMLVSFKVVGSPKEARLYRLDALKLQDLQSIKYAIDAFDESSNRTFASFADLRDDYAKNIVKKNEKLGNVFTFSSEGKEYKICTDFSSDMPTYINKMDNLDESWNYKKGNTCFTFPHKENLNPNFRPEVKVGNPKMVQ